MRDHNPPKYEKEVLNELLQNKEQIILHRAHFTSLVDLDEKLFRVAENYFERTQCTDNTEIYRQVQTLTNNIYFPFDLFPYLWLISLYTNSSPAPGTSGVFVECVLQGGQSCLAGTDCICGTPAPARLSQWHCTCHYHHRWVGESDWSTQLGCKGL